MSTRDQLIVSISEPGDPSAPYHVVIATYAEAEDLRIAAEHYGFEVTERRSSAVGTVLQWMAKRPRIEEEKPNA